MRCEYISDLQCLPYREPAKRAVSGFDLQQYPLHQLSDLADYLYGEKIQFETYEQAKAFFQQRVMK